MKATLTGKLHFLLYHLATAMRPRSLMTVDEEGKLLPVSVRVGQAVDVVAQAGAPGREDARERRGHKMHHLSPQPLPVVRTLLVA